MELSMSMRYVRIRARQKAQSGPVLAEHVMSALLMLAGADAQSVMPSGSDAVKETIAGEIKDLRQEFDALYGIGDPLQVMARLDELISARELDAGAEREYAALQADAENWMAANPSRGDTIIPVAMLHAVREKTELIVDEALTTSGSVSGAASAVASTETMVDLPERDPTATVIDAPDPTATVIDSVPVIAAEDEPDTEAEEAAKQAEEERIRRKAEAAAKREEERIRREEEERPEREQAERERAAAEERARREAAEDEARQQMIIQQAVLEAQRQALLQQERDRLAEAAKKKTRGKSAGAFIGFVIAMIIAWFVYLWVETTYMGGEAPWWMKIVFFIVYIIALNVSLGRIKKLRENPAFADTRTTMMRIRVVGSAGMIYFRTVLLSTIFPAALVFILYLVNYDLNAQGFWYHFLCLYVFAWGLGLINLAFQSNFAALSVGQLSYTQLKRKKAAFVGTMVSGVLTVPAFIYFLCWHFGWLPMKTWLIVVLIIYLVIGLISCIALARSNANDMQND